MHRQCGRHLNAEYYLEVESLPDDQLFSPTEIVKRKFDKKTQNESFTRMFHALYQFGQRNGLALKPDNGLKHPNGRPLMHEGKCKLPRGERSAKWYGATWKSKLYVEDHIAIRHFAETRLVQILSGHLAERTANLPQELEAKPKVLLFKKPKLKLLHVALVAAVLITASGIFQYDFLSEGYGVLREDGPKAAFEFFQQRGESAKNLFGKAFTAYRNGDYELAEKLSHRVLKSRDLSDKARASYLLGELKTNSGAYHEAEDYLQNALAIYESLGKENSRYRTLLLLAKLNITQKKTANAKYFTNLAELSPRAEEDEFFLFLRSQIAFLDQDYKGALALSLRREAAFSGDRSRQAGIYSDIGFYYGLLGNLGQSLDYAMKAQSIATALEDKNDLMYNNINLMLYQKCSFGNYQELRTATYSYAMEKNDVKLLDQIYFIDKFTCRLETTDSGHVPPPDRNLSGNEGPPPPDEVEGYERNIEYPVNSREKPIKN